MIKRIRYSCAPLLLLLSACSVNIDPISAEAESIYDWRPPSSYSYLFQSKTEWRKINLYFDGRNAIETAIRMDYFINVELSNCNGKTIFLEELYVNDKAFSLLKKKGLEKIAQKTYSTYLTERLYAEYSSICGRLMGGSKPFGHIGSSVFKIK